MADEWGIEVGQAGDEIVAATDAIAAATHERQLRADLAQECRATSADYAIVRQMVCAALVESIADDADTSLDGTRSTIVISFRAARA